MTIKDDARNFFRGMKTGGRRGRKIAFNALSPNVDPYNQGQPWAINYDDPKYYEDELYDGEWEDED